MYINVIYFFVTHENCVHTIFEPSAKKHLPFFSCFANKKSRLLCHNCYIILLSTKIYLVCKIITVEGIPCASAHCSIQFFLKEAYFLFDVLVADAK
jgi:hypothetical protein